jgi:hypothetical protein
MPDPCRDNPLASVPVSDSFAVLGVISASAASHPEAED